MIYLPDWTVLLSGAAESDTTFVRLVSDGDLLPSYFRLRLLPREDLPILLTWTENKVPFSSGLFHSDYICPYLPCFWLVIQY